MVQVLILKNSFIILKCGMDTFLYNLLKNFEND